MKNDVRLPDPSQRYHAAYKEHYGTKDLGKALGLYRGIISSDPDTREADYSRSQIENIVKAVVPKDELFDAQVSRALAHLAPAKDRNGVTSASEEEE